MESLSAFLHSRPEEKRVEEDEEVVTRERRGRKSRVKERDGGDMTVGKKKKLGKDGQCICNLVH